MPPPPTLQGGATLQGGEGGASQVGEYKEGPNDYGWSLGWDAPPTLCVWCALSLLESPACESPPPPLAQRSQMCMKYSIR